LASVTSAAREVHATKRRRRKASSASSTLADVAKLAGVSTASVSRALNGAARVSPDLKLRVEGAVKTLGWVPNGAAKALASQRSRTVGILLPRISHPAFGEVAEGLQLYLAQHGYTLLIGCTHYMDGSATEQALKMVERGIECVVLVGLSQPPTLLPYLRDRRIPSVITFTSARAVDHEPEGAKIIGFDNRLAMLQVVDHLLSLGHRRFGCITVSREATNDRMVHRVDGVREALAREGLAIRPQHLVEMPRSTIECGREALVKILDSENAPTAIVCTNDFFALGALFEARSRGVGVPNRLSITGFDDLEVSAYVEPGLTTVRIPTTRMGLEVGRYVVDRLEGKAPSEPPELSAELVVRGSSGGAPG
jgi:LacI family transcriptional regulator